MRVRQMNVELIARIKIASAKSAAVRTRIVDCCRRFGHRRAAAAWRRAARLAAEIVHCGARGRRRLLDRLQASIAAAHA